MTCHVCGELLYGPPAFGTKMRLFEDFKTFFKVRPVCAECEVHLPLHVNDMQMSRVSKTWLDRVRKLPGVRERRAINILKGEI